MAEESLIEDEDENILYDLLVITEWPPETDTQVSQTRICVRFRDSMRVFCLTLSWKNARGKSTLISCMGSAAQSHVAQTYVSLLAELSYSYSGT